MPDKNPHGKICYIEIPAIDLSRSSEFYEKVFGWRLRRRGDGAIAFDDTTGAVSGTWVVGRPPADTPGLLIYIWCDSVAAAVDAVIAQGGEIVDAEEKIGAFLPLLDEMLRDGLVTIEAVQVIHYRAESVA